MHVVDHEPWFWFLLQDEQGWLLDISCSHGAVGYSVLIRLDDEDSNAYQAGGHVYLSELAERVHNSAPGVLGSLSPYKERNLGRAYADAVSEAVRAWRAAPQVD